METLRRRLPFKIVDDEDIRNYYNNILDDEQQEALVENLRRQHETMNTNHHLALNLLVGLSALLRLVAISHNPLLALYPVTPSGDPSIPLPHVFSFLSLFVHLNFVLMFWSDNIRIYLRLATRPTSLSFPKLYCLSAVAPTFSLLLGKPWQTLLWWSTTPFMVFVMQTILDSIQSSAEDITRLEALRYTAPSA